MPVPGITQTGADPANTPEEEIIDSRCIVKFRPHDKWEGEYGFDWFREGDYGEILKSNNGRCSSHYKNDKLIGRYHGGFLLCMGNYNVPNIVPNKDEFSDGNGKTIYCTIYGQRIAFFSDRICSNCRNRNSCPFHSDNNYKKHFVYEENYGELTGKPYKIDPDVGDILFTQTPSFDRYDSYGNLTHDYFTGPYERSFEDYYGYIQYDNPTKKYYIPTISLFYKNDANNLKNEWGKTTATVKLLIEGSNSTEFALEFKCTNGIEQIEEIPGVANQSELLINISLNEDFSVWSLNNGDGVIKVYAKTIENNTTKKTLAGILKVEKCIPRSVDIVFVPFITQLPNSAVSVFKNISEHAGYLKRFLSQAHVIPNIYMYNPNNFSARTMNEINDVIRNHTQVVRYPNGRITGEKALDIDYKYDNQGNPIKEDMGKKLEELFNHDNSWLKYRNAYKILLFGENGRIQYDQQWNRTQNLGRGNGIPSKAAVIFSLDGFSNTTSTICHELLHCFGFFHSFSNNSPYTLKKGCTSNVMDYPVSPFELQTLWKWQWDKIRSARGLKPMKEGFVEKLLPKIDLPKVRIK